MRPFTRTDRRELTGRKVLAIFIAFFGVVFGANLIMVRAATVTFGGVETDSSYRAGLTFKRELFLAHAQDARAWKVDAGLRRLGSNATEVEVSARDAQGRPIPQIDLVLTIAHPTDKRRDLDVSVREVATGRFKGLTEIPPGQWDVVIVLWRDGERAFRSQSRVTIQ